VRRRLLLGPTLVLVGALSLLGGPEAGAVGQPETGWWSRLATTSPTDEVPAALPAPAPTTPDTVPAGATVPDGQLLVEGTPEGATAVAAVRWTLEPGESSPSLTLPVAPGSTLNPESVVLACKASVRWTPPAGPGGSWDTKPLVDASRCVNGVIADDLSTIGFGLQPLVSGQLLDIVLVPGRVPSSTLPPGVPQPPADVDGSAFRLLVDAPTAESLEVVAGASGGGPSAAPIPTPSSTAAVPPPAAVPTPSFTGSSPPSPVVPPAPVAEPSLDAGDLAPSVPDLAAAPAGAVERTSVDRGIGYVLLALGLLAGAWAFTQSPAADSIGLGRFRTTIVPAAGPPASAPTTGAPVVGGLSRFARERTTPPPPLS